MAEPLNATFFAFRKREQRGVLVRAALGFAIGLVILMAVFGVALWQVLAPALAWYGDLMSAGGDTAAVEALPPPPSALFLMFPAQFLFLFAFFVLFASFEAACHRWMIRGEAGGGLLGLRFGADTWRVYGVYWVWLLLAIALYVGFLVVFLVLIGSLSAAGDPGAVGLISVAAFLVLLAAVAYLCVRFAPAAATSVARQRFSFFEAWAVTRGRFWAILGAFLLLGLLNVAVSIVASSVAFGVFFGGAFAGVDFAAAASDPNVFVKAYVEALEKIFQSPAMLAMIAVYYICASAVSLVFYTLFFGVNARAAQAALEEGKIEVEAAD